MTDPAVLVALEVLTVMVVPLLDERTAATLPVRSELVFANSVEEDGSRMEVCVVIITTKEIKKKTFFYQIEIFWCQSQI